MLPTTSSLPLPSSFAAGTFPCRLDLPGYAPLAPSALHRREIVTQLAQQGRLNGQSFCVSCMARKPMRSKHCKLCKRCVARHDHHCPWVDNCIGSKTTVNFCYSSEHSFWYHAIRLPHRGLLLYQRPTIQSFAGLELRNVSLAVRVLVHGNDIRSVPVRVAVWATLQLSWTVILMVAQSWQIMRQMTTLEVSNLGRFGFMGGKGGQSYAGQTGMIAQHSARAQPGGAGAGAADRLQGIQKQQQGDNGQIDVNTGGADEDSPEAPLLTGGVGSSASSGASGRLHTHSHSHSKLSMLRKLCSASVAGSSPLLASISTHEAKPAKDSNEHRRLKPFRPRPTCQLQRLLVQRSRPQYRLYDPLRLASRDQPWTLRSCTISHRYCHRRQRKRLGWEVCKSRDGRLGRRWIHFVEKPRR